MAKRGRIAISRLKSGIFFEKIGQEENVWRHGV